MKNFKWSALTASFCSIGIIFYLLATHTFTVQSFSDTFFITSLFFLIIGIALWIMSSEFFDNFQNFMHMHMRLKKQNEPKQFIPLSEIGRAHQRYWIETGSFLLVIAIVSSLFYFL